MRTESSVGRATNQGKHAKQGKKDYRGPILRSTFWSKQILSNTVSFKLHLEQWKAEQMRAQYVIYPGELIFIKGIMAARDRGPDPPTNLGFSFWLLTELRKQLCWRYPFAAWKAFDGIKHET